MRQALLFDTSVLIAALVENHPSHSKAAPLLEQAQSGKIQLVICAHALGELYSILTSLPISPRISPDEARELIRENVLNRATVVELDESDYDTVIERMAERGLSGGMLYDGLHIQAAIKGGVDSLRTLNVNGIERIWPEHSGVIGTAEP